MLVLNLVYCSNQRQIFGQFAEPTCAIGVTTVRLLHIGCGSIAAAPKVVVAIILLFGIAEIRL